MLRRCSPYAWVPTSALLANSATPTTSESTTIAPSESLSDSESGDEGSQEGNNRATSTISSFAPFPSEWPSVIVPTNSQMLSAQTVPQNQTLISILFTEQMGWAWICSEPDASAQIFAFMPSLIGNAINITTNDVLTDKLVAYQPEDYNGSTGTILSVYLGYIPSSYVDALSAAIKAPNSAFYTKQSGIPLQLSKVVNPTLPITAYAAQGVSNKAVDVSSNSASSDGNDSASSDKKKTIIIAVVTSIGVFALALLAFFAIKAARKNKGQSANMRSPNMQNNLRGFHLRGDSDTNTVMQQVNASRNVYQPPSHGGMGAAGRAHSGGYGTNALSRVYGFAAGHIPIFASQQSSHHHHHHQSRYDPSQQQNPFRISGYSDSSGSGSDHSHGSSAFTHSSDGYTGAPHPQHSGHWTGPRRSAANHHHASGRSSSIDFNSVDQDEVRNSWWRFSDGFGRAFSSPTTATQNGYDHHHHQQQQGLATSPISSTSGRAHIRNSTRRVNIQRGAISRPQMQENSLML